MRKWLSSVLVLIACATGASAQPGGPSGWQVERDSNGRVVAQRDAHGNWSTYRPAEGGRSTTITHFRNGVGEWQEKWIMDEEGRRVAELVRPGVPRLDDYARVLRLFGLAPGRPIPETTMGWDLMGERQRFSAESPFGSFERIESAGEQEVERRETTTVLGRSLSVTVKGTEQGFLLVDDAGGWRAERFGSGGLVSASDAHGVIARVERDQLGRPVAYRLGEVGVLRFTYSDSTPQWTAKELVDLRDGHVLFRWETAVRAGAAGPEAQSMTTRPRATVRLLIPGHGAVAEWDETLYPTGVMVARVGDHPYGLVPLMGNGDVVRSLTMFEERAARGWDRIDYTDEQLFVHVVTDAGDSDTAEQTAIVVLPRTAPEAVSRAAGAASRLSAPPIASVLDARSLRRTVAPLISVRPCGSPNVGCTCIDWNDGQEVRCPTTTDGGDGDGGGGGSEPPEPTGGGGGGTGFPSANPLTPRQTFILNNAMPRALKALTDHESCRKLFENLNRPDGAWVLDNTTYKNWSQNSNCSGNNAFTLPNWMTVYLCQGFETLSVSTAAATLIHEALHSAGKLEAPNYPDEMTSPEIQAMVERECHL